MTTEPLIKSPGNRVASRPTRVTAVEVVRRTLKDAILRGDIAGGTKLIQRDIAEELGVSTTPVREAMRDLAQEGLVQLESNRVGVVSQLNWDEMNEILRIRRLLERDAIQMAMSHSNPELLSVAREMAEDLATETDLGAWVEKNRRFHSLFHQATGSQRMSSILMSLEEAAGMFVAQAQRLHPENRLRGVEDHFRLIAAFERGDLDAAVAIQCSHIELPLGHHQ